MAETETATAVKELAERYSYVDPDEPTKGQEEVEAKQETPAEEPPAEEITTETTESLPPELLDRASRAGITPGDAAVFKSPEDLEVAVRLMESVVEKRAEPVEEEPKPAAATVTEYKVDLNPEDIDGDAIVKAIQGLAQHQAEQNAKLAEKVEASIQQAQQQAQGNDAMTWFDAKVESLGPEWVAVFGKGPTNRLTPGSQEYSRREALMGSVGGIGANRADLTEDQVFDLCKREFEGLVKKGDTPPPQKVVARPNRSVPGDNGEPFDHVRELYKQMTRDNGDE